MDHANLFLSNTQKAENSRLKKPVGQNFVIFFLFLLKKGRWGLSTNKLTWSRLMKKKKKIWPDTFEFIFLAHFVFNGSQEISHIPKKAVQKR